MSRRLLNAIVQHRPLNPRPLAPAGDWQRSEFADSTLDAYDLACQEADAERLTVGARLTRLSGNGPLSLKIISLDHDRDRIVAVNPAGDATVWTAEALTENYELPEDGQ
jgi:hypothetical protein